MFIPTTASTFLLWLYIIFIYTISTITLAQPPEFAYHVCDYTANYTRNTTFQRNLDSTLAALPTTNSGLGYFNHSIGRGNDRVISVALCRGDINPDACLNCLNVSTVNLLQRCPNQKGAIIYYDYCFLLYSNQDLSGNNLIISEVYLTSVQNSTDKDGFVGALRPLLRNLTLNAATGDSLRKFASGNTTGPDSVTIYGFVQCSPNLLDLRCSECLESAISRSVNMHGGSIGVRVILPTCNFRYEIYRFFNGSTVVLPSSPTTPPNSQAPPQVLTPSPEMTLFHGLRSGYSFGLVQWAKVEKTLKNWGPLKSGALDWALTFSKGEPALLRRRKQIASSNEGIETENIDFSDAESLQYDFRLVKASTNNFSEQNKLGQGGFGAVYKGTLRNGQDIAVKRLARDSGQGDVEFKNEVLLVARLHHRNLAWENWQNKTPTNVIDPALKTGSGSSHDIIRSIHIGLLCVQENIVDRPTMISIVLMLNSFSITLPSPSAPAFSIPREIVRRTSTIRGQVYDVSISEIVPR
ncbi:hypothetical protein QVD17_25851 [Tagetes erecta]|uniref:Cysteine-rich receptor-like protein kinase n=1 Tax=Tagetes erecta TaxID=13708 RepID=A0AAD8K5D8_TARER|nr:hypothetical protein QVD17_25851 [Tagetes erecta]